MNPQKKIKSLIVIVVFLLLSNIAMLVFFITLGNNNSHAMHHNMVGDFLKNELKFSKDQMVKYDTLRSMHFKNMRPYFENVKLAKDNFYNLLYTDQPADSAINNRAKIIGEQQENLDKQLFMHFSNLRKLCTPEQLPKFDSSFKNVVSKLTGRMKREEGHNNNEHH